jgi:acyl-coenzyme A thioesterase PaaI-like protein
MELAGFIDKAKTSRFRLWLLNKFLHRFIPFNKPHKFEIMAIGDEDVKIRLPFRRKNLNHIRGLHACALATLAEYTTGFMMITKLNPKIYRIIMKRIEMDYHYQGKSDAICHFMLNAQQLKEDVIYPLKDSDAITYVCEPKIYDTNKNHLATGKVYWQIKSWERVRTKL